MSKGVVVQIDTHWSGAVLALLNPSMHRKPWTVRKTNHQSELSLLNLSENCHELNFAFNLRYSGQGKLQVYLK